MYRSYGNWTDQGWNLRFRGNVYKQPNIDQEKLDDLANVFLIDTSVEELPPDQAAQARNMTASIFVLQQDDANVTFSLQPAPTAGASGEQGGGGAVTPNGGSQEIDFPNPTTAQGDFDDFVQIQSNGLAAGNSTSDIQRLNVYAQGSNIGNATSYLVPPTGLSIISDIDDILRITKIYQPKEGLLNSFARPFVQWMNMPDIYANWSRSIPDFHFHYLTTTPEQVTRNYMDFIYKTYPGGSFDTRPLNFSDVEATLSIRKYLLVKIFETFPERKFILVADTSNSDVMKAYPQMATEFPGQVRCIFLRNTSATDPGDRFPYDTSGFKDLDKNSYMFFKVPVWNSLSFPPPLYDKIRKLTLNACRLLFPINSTILAVLYPDSPHSTLPLEQNETKTHVANPYLCVSTGRSHEPRHPKRTMPQRIRAAEPHLRLPRLTLRHQPGRRR